MVDSQRYVYVCSIFIVVKYNKHEIHIIIIIVIIMITLDHYTGKHIKKTETICIYTTNKWTHEKKKCLLCLLLNNFSIVSQYIYIYRRLMILAITLSDSSMIWMERNWNFQTNIAKLLILMVNLWSDISFFSSSLLSSSTVKNWQFSFGFLSMILAHIRTWNVVIRL